MRRSLSALFLAASCGGASTPVSAPPPQEAPPSREEPARGDGQPPWAVAPVASDEVPPVYVAEWLRATNNTRCPLFVVTEHGAGAGASPRRIDFGIGWGVAYDKQGLPGTAADGNSCDDCGRSAFGVAGTAASRGSPPTRAKSQEWSDGSKLYHGPTGRTGRIGYLEVAGLDCQYHVWSALGEAHLETLVRGLRRVDYP